MEAAKVRQELLAASDAVIEDAVAYADPMVLRGLIYQLTGDAEILATKSILVVAGFAQAPVVDLKDVPLLRRKAVEFLKTYRDSGAADLDIGPKERLPVSLGLTVGDEIKDPDDLGLCLEELALDPFVRSLEWSAAPPPDRLKNFSVTIIGAGLGCLTGR